MSDLPSTIRVLVAEDNALERSTLVDLLAALGHMVVAEVPGPSIRIPIWLIWHEARRRDAGHAWLRGVVQREMQAAAIEAGLLAEAAAPK